ncbi:MAG: Ig-like domain-containing protein [Clostridiales bacterium]|nr:Ig-like domain-containing protein [Candidatus Cacconaster stercorequi]
MSLLKCPNCGEMFSDTYSSCPFCAEDDDLYSGKQVRTARRLEKRKGPSILGPAMIVVLVLLAALLIYTFCGGRIAKSLQGEDEPGTEQTTPGEDTAEKAPLEMGQSTMKLTVGESKTLTFTGASSVKWTSSNEGVATVAEDGTVTAVAAGEATVSAVADDQSAACEITVVKPEPKPEKKVLTMATAFGDLPKGDKGWEFTSVLSKKESFQLVIDGTDADVTWSTSNSKVATVSADGTFKAVGKGEATITATVDEQELTCRVTVK